jgi:hypothetical protein
MRFARFPSPRASVVWLVLTIVNTRQLPILQATAPMTFVVAGKRAQAPPTPPHQHPPASLMNKLQTKNNDPTTA